MKEILKDIKTNFNNKVSLQEKRPGIYQLFLPIFHEDGDMVELFITPNDRNGYLLCDYGLTLQRLAYSYDIDTENKEAILEKILKENGLTEEDGNICMPTKRETIYTDILHITQAFSKVGSMKFFKRSVIEHLFFEQLEQFIKDELTQFKPEKKISPMPKRPELEVDYKFQPNGHPIYLFAVKDSDKAKLATISMLEFLRANLNFTSVVVNEDFEKLSKRDRSLLTNTCDKQFTSLEEFKSNGRGYFERQIAI